MSRAGFPGLLCVDICNTPLCRLPTGRAHLFFVTRPALVAIQHPFIKHFSFPSPPQLFLPLGAFLRPHVLAVAALSLRFLPDQGFCAGSSPAPLFNAINSLKSLASWFIIFFFHVCFTQFQSNEEEKKKRKDIFSNMKN